MINETGKNLHVLILTSVSRDWETFGTWYSVHKNLPEASIKIACLRTKDTPLQLFQWTKRLKVETFRFNGSLERRLIGGVSEMSEAEIIDHSDNMFWYLNWPEIANTVRGISLAYKDNIPKNILILRPFTMVLSTLNQNLLDFMNMEDFSMEWINEDAWFLKDLHCERLCEWLTNCYSSTEGVKDKCPVTIQEEPLYCDAKDPSCSSSLVNYKKGCGKWIDTMKGCPFPSAARFIQDNMTANENEIIELWKKMVPIFSVVV